MAKEVAVEHQENDSDLDLLGSFNWDGNEAGEHNFFGITPEKTTTEKQKEVIEKVKNTELPKTTKTTTTVETEEIDDEEEYVPFSDKQPTKKEKETVTVTDPEDENTEVVVPDEDEDEDNPKDDPEDDTKFFTDLTKELKEKGVFSNIDIKDDEEITEEKFFELQEQEVDSRLDETIKGFIADLNEDKTATDLIKFVKEGGKSEDFFKVYATAPSITIPEDIDITQEKNQKLVAKYYLQTVEGLDESEAADRIEYLDEKGKLEESTEKWNNKLQNIEKKAKDDLLKNQTKARDEAKKTADSFKATLKDELEKTESVGVFKFSPTDKKTLVDAVTKPTVKVGDNRYISSFQSKMTAIMKDPKKLLILAKIVENDFDVEDIVSTLETKVTNKVKSTLAETKKNKVLTNSGNSTKSKSLYDYF